MELGHFKNDNPFYIISVLAEDAIKAALADYKIKQQKEKEEK